MRAAPVLAVSGWVKGFHSIEPSLEAGYFGLESGRERKVKLLGREVPA